MKIIKSILLFGTGLTVGVVSGVELAGICIGYRFGHLKKDDKILTDKENSFRVTVLTSHKDSNVRLAMYEDLTSNRN